MTGLLRIVLLILAQASLSAASDPDRFIISITADTFIHAGQPDVEESDLKGTEKCAVPCKLSEGSTQGDPKLNGPCGCIGPEGNCNGEFTNGIVRDLCERMGNNPVTGFTQSSAEFRNRDQPRQPAKQHALQLKAGAECWREASLERGICNVVFAPDTQPLLKWLVGARSKNIKFSHCSLSFGDEPPLKSTSCFTPNKTLSEGAPRVVLAHLRALTPAQSTQKLRFTASYDDNWEFVTQELVFDTQYEVAMAPQST